MDIGFRGDQKEWFSQWIMVSGETRRSGSLNGYWFQGPEGVVVSIDIGFRGD
jgi:hypothetical protein